MAMESTVVLDAVERLEQMAEAGKHPQEVAAAAAEIVAGWWLGTVGDTDPSRLVVLVQDLRMWCTVTCNQYAWRYEQLQRLGRPEQADEARRWAVALDEAQKALRLYD
jgi:hypothetical protein